MNHSNTKKITNKLVSGRLWLTAICGLSFLAFVITMCQILYIRKDIFSGSELSSIINILMLIISNVMTFYFTKNRDDMLIEKKDNAAFIAGEKIEDKTEDVEVPTKETEDIPTKVEQ